MTHNNQENISMMDAVTPKYGKTTFVTVSKTLAIVLLVLFFLCLIATGVLVYCFTPTCPSITPEVAVELPAPTFLPCNITTTTHVEETVRTTTPSTRRPTTTPLPLLKQEHLDIRLPKYIVPDSYKISLIPFIREDNFTFHGEEEIVINVTEASSNVTLHCVGLAIDFVSVTNMKKTNIPVKSVQNSTKQAFIIIDLDGVLEAGQQYTIAIKFRGVLANGLQGFYRSSYKENNVTRWLASTQFQATDARKAFPCFDEPAMKAKFKIKIARLRNMTAISNMPLSRTIERVKGLSDYVWDEFQESVPMSTYLVAFVISDFKNISHGKFNVWARPSVISQAREALKIGPIILKYYEEFFGIDYPLQKVDMVAISDFGAGAMENWGLITFRESALLYEEGVSSILFKQSLAHFVAHELAHQWFGNLVTPVWWEDLWLNEGFASYVEYLGAYAADPRFKDLDLFVVNQVQNALRLDALQSSHPISVKVNDPLEINEIFDSISYAKGAAVIRMMRNFLGHDTFHKGLNKYLEKKKYKNAEQDDLWQSMTEAGQSERVLPKNVTVKEIMDTWTLQVGFPVVTAKLLANGSLEIAQEKYMLDKKESGQNESLWWVPVSIVDSTHIKKKHFYWLKKEQKLVVDNAVSPNASWFLINVNQNYYRSHYDDRNWKSVGNQLMGQGHKQFDPKVRAQLIDDALSLAYVGYLSYDVALNVTLYLNHERDYVPWKAALAHFEYLYHMFVRTAHFVKFKNFMISLTKDIYVELAYKDNEDPLTVLTRIDIMSQACRLADKGCVLQAVQAYQNWMNNAFPDKENSINADLRPIIYCTAIADGGQDEWDFAWNRYLNVDVPSDQELLLNALACSKDVWILSRYLEWSITENSGIRKHDVSSIFGWVGSNPVGHDLAYKFFKTNWKRIRDYLGQEAMSLGQIVKSLTENFNTEEEVNDFTSFFERRKSEFEVASRTAQQAIEQGKANTKWMKNYFEIVKNWFENAVVV